MPVPQRQLRQPGHDREQADARERDEEQRGEHARNIELEADWRIS
jgi:hypothetical protein